MHAHGCASVLEVCACMRKPAQVLEVCAHVLSTRFLDSTSAAHEESGNILEKFRPPSAAFELADSEFD